MNARTSIRDSWLGRSARAHYMGIILLVIVILISVVGTAAGIGAGTQAIVLVVAFVLWCATINVQAAVHRRRVAAAATAAEATPTPEGGAPTQPFSPYGG